MQILLDGGFVTRKLIERLGRPPMAADIVALCEDIRENEHLSGYELMRIYYYDAPPSIETVKLPVSGSEFALASTERARRAQSLYDHSNLRIASRCGWARRGFRLSSGK